MGSARQDVIEAVLALAIVLAAVVARAGVLATVLLALLSAVFPIADQAWEGAVLVTLTPGHGVTIADLLGVAGLLWALWLTWRRVRGGSVRGRDQS